MENPSNTLTRLMQVQAELAREGIAKSQRNQQQNYNYRGIDEVQKALAPLLALHNLMILPRIAKREMIERTTANGKVAYHHFVEMEYLIVGPEGQLGPYLSAGECLDTSDKGLNKACTAAYKYWILTAFCVPIEGQDDADHSSPEAQAEVPRISPEQAEELETLIKASKADREQFLKYYKAEDVADLTPSQHAIAVRQLQKKMSENAGGSDNA